MLTAEKIYCVRNSRLLFSDIHFSIAPGEMLQVGGHNGVGKSSLLRIVAGLLQPESGQVFWNNQLIMQSDFYQHLHYLGHLLGIKSELTILENILFALPDSQCSLDHIKIILKNWSLDNVMYDFCGTLSQGQRQRVALARLQLSTKRVWILDEPFANLDNHGILQLEKLLQNHLNNGGVILLSTHHERALKGVKPMLLEL
ncbi:MAG: heme ABC exporter, ATP-binding protein CcmA [Gammaproteobacteria bacterium RIFCSPHIGHO2_12_FULL_40_19]|nr:MAG: heme ABC exporter, ATP-binding protein CcmA [Gammaproteobacteria bacterium RIFCSPHIGHO2_12_FULL_40_19]